MKDLTPDHPLVRALIRANRRIDAAMMEMSMVSIVAAAFWVLS